MNREMIVRDLAVQSLEASATLEEYLQHELIVAAVQEGITFHEVLRERLLLKAGVASIGALFELADLFGQSKTLLGRVEEAQGNQRAA